MSRPFDISVSGIKELQDAIGRFAREVRHDTPTGYMQGVRLAAAFVAQSLSARTAQAKPGHPKFRKATEMDVVAVAQALGHDDKWIHGTWKAIQQQGGAYVGMSGYINSRGLPYKPVKWISGNAAKNKDGSVPTIRELNRRWAYQYAGLAKASWLTMKQQSQRVPKMGTFKDKIAAVLPKLAVVWVRPESLSIHFHNKTSYISSATPPSAIEDAVRAGTNRLVGYTEQQIEKAKRKAGLA